MRIPAPLSAGLLATLLLATPAARQDPAPRPAQPPQPAGSAPAPAGQAQGGQAPAEQEPTRADQPPIRSGINFVSVDVIVTDNKGQQVLDLKPEDFSVTEDGKPQKIETFSVISIKESDQVDAEPPREIRSTSDEEVEAKRPDVRLFILLLDDYHVRRGNDMSVRKPLIDFIENQLAPQDMVALMYPLTPVTDLQFTRNRRELTSAVEHFLGRKFDYTPRNQFEEQYAYYPASVVEKVRNDVTMGALRGAAVKLGTMREGRKSIIFVSEGFTSTLPPQLNDPIAAMPRVGNPSRGNPNASVPDNVQFFNSAELISDMREVFDTANRQNTSIYAVDPRGLAGFEYDINEGVGLTADLKQLTSTQDTLRVLAENTDGRAIVNRNDIGAGMKQIIRDQSGYYLLGYNSTVAPTDGRFHEIKVKVARRGLDVRARKGYWAYTADDVARANKAAEDTGPPAAVSAALNSIAEPARGRPARFWIGTAQGDGGKGAVTFAWETITGAASGDSGGDNAPARVLLTATGADGRPLFRGRVPDEGTSARSASTSFAAPPGQVQLRMVVENDRGQVIDSATQDLTVPDFTSVQVSMSTPRVYRARTVREAQTFKADPAGAPTADRAFSRTERMVVRVAAYAPGGETPELTARLLNRTGEAMADVPVQATGGDGIVDLALSPLAAGDYLVELNAKTPSGTAQELVAFKVVR